MSTYLSIVGNTFILESSKGGKQNKKICAAGVDPMLYGTPTYRLVLYCPCTSNILNLTSLYSFYLVPWPHPRYFIKNDCKHNNSSCLINKLNRKSQIIPLLI